MNFPTFPQLGRSGRRFVWTGALVGLSLAAGSALIGDISPEAKRRAQTNQDFSLFAGPTAVLRGNQLQCGLLNNGNGTCADVFNSPTGGGGFWPTGSSNQYIFNTGVQVAGIMGDDGGPWANDTVGAFFFDASGNNPSGAGLTPIFDSLNPDDVAGCIPDPLDPDCAWPPEAIVSNAELFQPVLVGRLAASQQDSWMQYWDGNPAQIAGRQHTMGVTVTSRSLAWNFPAGNESLIYFIFDIENVTGTTEFQTLSENAFFGGANALPDAGITLNEVYTAFSTDMDVTALATENFSTAILPFDLGLSYHGGFNAPSFTYFPDLFFPPFFTNAPGLIGIKYLRSPINPETGEEVGLTLFSTTFNPGTALPGQLPDPSTDKQLWRYLAGKLSAAAGDIPCNVPASITSPNPANVVRALCFTTQQAGDTRFYQSSGPFPLPAGDVATIVVAYIAAATVETLPDGSSSGIIANTSDASANPPGVPSFHPGFPSARGCDSEAAVNCTVNQSATENAVKPIEHGAGWVEYTGPPPSSALETSDHKLDQFEVEVVPGSLLGRALVAQTIFDSQFLLGFGPTPPDFFLIPGDNQVTIVWEESVTEDDTNPTGGDPFFAVASDPTSALFNPNYRQFDVEGYRIWRGTTAGTLDLIEQFDYVDTEFVDTTCETVEPGEDLHDFSSAPEGTVGFVTGDDCPADFVKTSQIGPNLLFNNGEAGGVPGAGVFRLIDGSAVFNGEPMGAIDFSEAGPREPLGNTGVPFVFTDSNVENGFTYFYAVSAFDVNSPASGPPTLRSARISKPVVPRAQGPNAGTPFAFSVELIGDDGQPLDTDAPAVQPDPQTGIFPGPQPPTNATDVFFSPDPSAVGRLLSAGEVVMTLDSVVPVAGPMGGRSGNPCPAGSNGRDMCWRAYLSVDNGTSVSQSVVNGQTPFAPVSFGEPEVLTFSLGAGILPFSDAELNRVGIPDGFGSGVNVGVTGDFNGAIANSATEALVNRFSEVDDSEPGGSRWFDGDTETLADPTIFTKAGELAGIDTIYHPISHTNLGDGVVGPAADAPASGDMVCWPYTMSFLTRAADVRFTWGANTFESVRDVTHRVEVPFAPNPRTTWGFMTEDANGNGVIDWQDFDYLDGINQNTEAGAGFLNFFCALGDRGIVEPPIAQLSQTLPGLVPVSTEGIQPEDMSQTGTGFGLYVNGEHYIFETSSLPAAGTEWTLRTYHGYVQADDPLTTDPSNYRLNTEDGGATNDRPPMVAGLRFRVNLEEAGTAIAQSGFDLAQVHTVPDPYLGTSLNDLGPTSKVLQFVNLPPEATIRIYSLTGVLVDVIVHEDQSGGGRAEWDIRNRNSQFVASGVYFFHVVTPNGEEHVGKFTIIQQAGSN